MNASLQATPSATFRTFEDVRLAFFNKDLSRTFDRRSFAEGNIREGVVSTAHGDLHRARRRLENAQFRPDMLRSYEFDLFPQVLGELLDTLIAKGNVDLLRVGSLLGTVLTARRVGVDVDWRSLDQLVLLDRQVEDLIQMSAILDATDPEAARTFALKALADWQRDFVGPSKERRERMIRELGPDSTELPNDLLTALLLHRKDRALQIDDDDRIVRELATYAVGGTSAVTLVNAVDLLLPLSEKDPSLLTRVAADRAFAQRCVHETLRLRPTTPAPKRYVEADTHVGETLLTSGSVVILDVAHANRDELVFGPTALEFDPDRQLPDGIALWGLAFGAGVHQCPGRSVAGGFPVPNHLSVDDDHLYGLIAIILQESVRRGVRLDTARAPLRDRRTDRGAWLSYPVVFDS